MRDKMICIIKYSLFNCGNVQVIESFFKDFSLIICSSTVITSLFILINMLVGDECLHTIIHQPE